MGAEGTITRDESARMVLGAYPRQRRELLAPFDATGQFSGLTVERCELSSLPDAAWTEYETSQEESFSNLSEEVPGIF